MSRTWLWKCQSPTHVVYSLRTPESHPGGQVLSDSHELQGSHSGTLRFPGNGGKQTVFLPTPRTPLLQTEGSGASSQTGLSQGPGASFRIVCGTSGLQAVGREAPCLPDLLGTATGCCVQAGRRQEAASVSLWSRGLQPLLWSQDGDCWTQGEALGAWAQHGAPTVLLAFSCLTELRGQKSLWFVS